MLTTPLYSHVGDRRVHFKIENLELKTPNNSPLERDPMGDLPHMFYLINIKESQNNPHFQKSSWEKISICTKLCMTKHITYIHTYKPGYISS